jgi:hypothetical protein
MQKLDRLGWTAGIAFRSYGLRIGVRVTDHRAMKQVLQCLPPGWRPAASPIVDHLFSLVIGGVDPNRKVQRFSLAYYDAVNIARSKDLESVLKIFESELLLLVADNARRRIFVHAGVVAWKNRAIVIPGLSFSGKTTLVNKLVQAGATYYSDEYAVLDERGRVHPFPRPLGIRQPGQFETERVDIASLGGAAGVSPLPVSLVVATNYRAGARWRPRRLSPGRGVLELLANTVSARSQTKLALATLPKAVRSAAVLKGIRGEADEVVESILAEVARAEHHRIHTGS